MEFTTPDGIRTLTLSDDLVDAIRDALPEIAKDTIAHVAGSVSQYSGLPPDGMRDLAAGVQWALGGFLRLAAASGHPDQPADPAVAKVLDASYRQGRIEARTGRTADAVQAAYRIGARRAWRDVAAIAIDHGVDPTTIADMAELLFAYIDQLSAANVAGYTEELATTGRVREQRLHELGLALLRGEPEATVIDKAAPLEWPVPTTLTVVLLPLGQVSTVVAGLPTHTLVLPASVADVETPDEVAVMLVPDASRTRTALRRRLRSARATIGPERPWQQASQSLQRAALARRVLPDATSATVDTDERLVELLTHADASLVTELRAQVLAPLDGVRPGTRLRLEETLRSWLLHQGRREDVAADLNLHPQTIRYRMDQVKELFGESLRDPQRVLAITIALADREAAPPPG